MAKTVCEAKKRGIVKRRGRPTVEWHKDGVPQRYCYGCIDMMTDEPLEVCRNCADHVDRAEEDREKYYAKERD